MKYYKLKESIKGLRTIFYAKLPKEYDFNAKNSIRKLKFRGKLEFTPNLNGIELKNSFNPNKRDIMILSSTGNRGGIIISDKLLEVINEFKLPNELQVFDVNAIHKGIDYHYNYFYLYNPKQEEYLNFKEMLFYETNMVGIIKRELKINNYNDYLNFKNENKLIQIYPNQLIFLKEKINTDIFNLSYIGLGYYVSERLKEAIEEANCQGIEFTPIEELNYTLK